MNFSRKFAWLFGCSLLLLGIYFAMSESHARNSRSLIIFANLILCAVPLLANTGLLLNAGSPHWRRNLFWMLLSMGCTLWMIAHFQWTYFELYLGKPRLNLHPGDILYFLRGIPLMAALFVQPHRAREGARLRIGYIDFALLLCHYCPARFER